jgi:TonB-linked SusC/RagA family outer membrane protein
MKNALLLEGSVVVHPVEPLFKKAGKKHPFIKGFVIMKLIVLLTIVACVQTNANGYAQTINLSLKNVTIEKVFKEIEKQSSYHFIYTKEQLENTVSISIDLRDATITAALDICFKGQPIIYTIHSPYIIIKRKEEKMVAEAMDNIQTNVKGRVTNEAGEGIAGVTIAIKGSTIATASNDDGQFELDFTGTYTTLEISCIGYKKTEVVFSGRNFISVRLETVVNSLDETIVIGYGNTTRRLNTGNVSKVNAEEISKQPVANVLGALQGRVPGLLITQSSGVPGATYKVQIRGQNSLFQGSDPLFVIDGVPFLAGNSTINQINTAALLSPFNLINPADIESVEILKDADATSIYGSRGANGVILITTKKGKAGKTRFTANVFSGASKTTRTMEMLNTTQYLEMRKEAFANDGITANAVNAPDLFAWDTTIHQDLKELLTGGTGYITDAQISVSGGTESTHFLMSWGLNKQTTVFPGDLSDTRGTFHLNLDHSPGDKKFFIRLSTSYGSDKNTLSSYDLSTYINMPPHIHLYDSSGKLNWKEGGSSFYSLGITNPLAYLLQEYTGKFDNLVSSVQAGYRILKQLNFKASFGHNLMLADEVRINPSTSLDPATNQLPFSYFGKRKSQNWIIEPQLDYVKTFSKGKLNLLIGGTWQENKDELFSVTASNYTNDLQLRSTAAAGNVVTNNNYSQYRYMSFFGRANFSWQDKYIANLTARRDASSRFGPGKQFSNFGSIGAAWIFSKENFIAEILPFISFGKLRASYGTAGNDNIGNYQYLDTWNNTSTTYQNSPGLIPSRLYNPDYSWEVNKKLEAAIDLGFFKDRLKVSVSYFKNRCSNQLVPYTLPIQTGFSSVNQNLDALIENKGFEFFITGRNIVTKNFNWTSIVNLTIHRNKLLEFPGLAISSYATTYAIGEPVSVKKLYQFLGVDPVTGIYQFNDADRNGIFNVADRIVLKNTEPKFYGGFQNSFSYKNFQLDIFLEFRKQEGLNYLYTQVTNVPGYDFRNQPEIVQDRWQKQGDVSPIQKFTSSFSTQAYTNGAFYLSNSEALFSDASFIRCKNVFLSYHLSNDILQKMKMENLMIYLQGQNLFTLTNYTGADPENQNLYVLPPLQTFAAGIKLIF